jgi:hypothetical protein
MWDVQIVRWRCNVEQNQKWDVTWDPTTGAFNLVSPVSQKCWDNYDANVGGRLSQSTCNSGSIDNKRFYLEYQGFVANCGGSADRKVRSPLADTSVTAPVLPLSLTSSVQILPQLYCISLSCELMLIMVLMTTATMVLTMRTKTAAMRVLLLFLIMVIMS